MLLCEYTVEDLLQGPDKVREQEAEAMLKLYHCHEKLAPPPVVIDAAMEQQLMELIGIAHYLIKDGDPLWSAYYNAWKHALDTYRPSEEVSHD